MRCRLKHRDRPCVIMNCLSICLPIVDDMASCPTCGLASVAYCSALLFSTQDYDTPSYRSIVCQFKGQARAQYAILIKVIIFIPSHGLSFLQRCFILSCLLRGASSTIPMSAILLKLSTCTPAGFFIMGRKEGMLINWLRAWKSIFYEINWIFVDFWNNNFILWDPTKLNKNNHFHCLYAIWQMPKSYSFLVRYHFSSEFQAH